MDRIWKLDLKSCSRKFWKSPNIEEFAVANFEWELIDKGICV